MAIRAYQMRKSKSRPDGGPVNSRIDTFLLLRATVQEELQNLCLTTRVWAHTRQLWLMKLIGFAVVAKGTVCIVTAGSRF